MYKVHFCLIWKSNGISFNKAMEEFKINFKVVNIALQINMLKVLKNMNTNLEKLTKMIVYDIEIFNTDRSTPYAMCVYRLNRISCKFYGDITDQELENCYKDCIVFKGTDSINEMLDHDLEFKGEGKNVNYKIVNYNLYISAHNGSGLLSYVVLNDLLLKRTVVNIIQNG